MNNLVTITRFDSESYNEALDQWQKGQPLVDWHKYWVTTDYDLDQMSQSELIDLLRELIDRHDYTFDFSDDHSVWMNGMSSLDKIKKVGARVPRDIAAGLWYDKFGGYTEIYRQIF